MSQLNFIDTNDQFTSCKNKKNNYWKVFIDGASRNNPGPAGAGVYILKNDKVILKKGFYLGSKTNNQAEYLALILGIFYLKKKICKNDMALIISDSQLLVRQIERTYKVKNLVLKPLYQLANQLLHDIHYNILHVLREENTDADMMANVGIDKKTKLPEDFVQMLQRHEIQL